MEHPAAAVTEVVGVTGREDALQRFTRLYRELFPPLYGYVRFRVGDPHAAEDLTAQVFERALSRLASLRLPDRIRAWLFTIARNAITDARRAHRPMAELETVEKLEHLWVESPESEVLRRGRQYADFARAILEQPAAAWWFGPLDAARQVWIARDGSPPAPGRLVTPHAAPSRWERYAQKPAAGLFTSTLMQGTSPVFTAVERGAGDFAAHYALPAACWRLEAAGAARIFEIDGPQAWHRLCVRYPARGEDGRLVPDWSAVAIEWDAVHLTFGGLLTSEQVRVLSADGWSQHRGWDVEQTLWLRWVFTTSERLPDYRGSAAPIRLAAPLWR